MIFQKKYIVSKNMKNIITITTEFQLNDINMMSDGHYNIVKHGHCFEYGGQNYTYHNSGLARSVYVSDCGKYVIKVPNTCYLSGYESLDEFLTEDMFKYADASIQHNYYEAEAYKKCPKKFKKYLAKTELLPNCWVKQEFVEVKNCPFTGRHDLREIGVREDGSLCIFDFDPLLNDFVFTGFNWEKLPKMIDDIKIGLNK